MRRFKDSATRRKDMRHNAKTRRQRLGEKEVSRANHAEEQTKIIFVNIGLGKQKTAKNFWVSLPKPLPIQRIRNRVETAFGDLI